MKLKKLLHGVKVLNAKEIKNVNIEHLSIDTNDIKDGTLFICLKGTKFDGHEFKREAKNGGAVCFLVENIEDEFDGLQILVESTRQALSIVAKNFYCTNGMPKVIGITGTNGKTTTTFMVKNILECAGKNVGVIGTEGIIYGNKKLNFAMTTPDPIQLFRVLGDMKKNKVEYAVMEVSAHAIALKKIDAIDFFVRALTNITEDHLDFFKALEDYRKTKLQFLQEGKCFKVINKNDPNVQNFAQKRSIFYGLDGDVDVFGMAFEKDYSKFSICFKKDEIYVASKLIGKYNLENALCAASIAKCLKIKNKYIKKGLETFTAVEGRLNVYRIKNKKVIIDFAHTPDAFNNVIKTVKEGTSGKIFCVFGCGGNRETQKRPVMGEIASHLCDFVTITTDNPRFERAEDICRDIANGINSNNYEIIIDRKTAIKRAYEKMADGDVLLVLGKGAENYIDMCGVKQEYSDREVVLGLGEVDES